MTALEFLQEFYGCYDDFGVDYRPYEHGLLVETISVQKAAEMLEKDIADMREFLSEEKAREAVFAIWKKHLVKF